MAGAVAERAAKPGKGGLRRPKRRINIRIDMTPMVDIAFLLLIFYMVSTVFAMPQAMEINLPPDDQIEEVEIKESNLLTVRVDGEGRFWWNLKTPSPDNLPLLLPSYPDTPDSVAYEFNADTLRGLLLTQNRENSKLSTLVLIHRDANYKDMVNILDEVDVIERSWNAYMMDSLGVKKVSELTKAQKFSYRYAIGDWEPRDDKIIDAAVNQAAEGGEL
jgi:biopolymer transport protein ExbD